MIKSFCMTWIVLHGSAIYTPMAVSSFLNFIRKLTFILNKIPFYLIEINKINFYYFYFNKNYVHTSSKHFTQTWESLLIRNYLLSVKYFNNFN